MSPRRFPPQSPAHPGWKQDDSVKQVSWLPVLSLSSTFPRRYPPQWLLDDRSPVTVAGAAAVSNRVPLNPFREPRAYLNANGWRRRRSTRDCATYMIDGAGPLIKGPFFRLCLNAISPVWRDTPGNLWMKSIVERFAAYVTSPSTSGEKAWKKSDQERVIANAPISRTGEKLPLDQGLHRGDSVARISNGIVRAAENFWRLIFSVAAVGVYHARS